MANSINSVCLAKFEIQLTFGELTSLSSKVLARSIDQSFNSNLLLGFTTKVY